MVRMGEDMSPQAKTFLSSAVEASEIVADMLKTNFRVDVDPEDMEKVEGMLAKEVRRETFRAANSAKYERELDEKYGLLKDVILHPTIQWMIGVGEHLWRNFHLFGKPPLGTTAGVIVAFMIYRRKVGLGNMCLAMAVLSGLNPVVFVVVIVLWKLWVSWGTLPKKHKPKMQGAHRSPAGELEGDQLSSDFNPDEIPDEDRQYDDIVVGSGLGGLYCAALLARCGRRVLVLEQGPLVGGGAVVKAPKDSGDWEFETGIQCLGGGDSLARHVKRLSLAFVPGTEALAWEQVGKGESDLACYDVVSIGSGKQQHLVFPAGMDKLLESLTTQFPERRKLLTALMGQMTSSVQTTLVFYLSKIFRVRPDRYVDRVVKSIFIDPSVTSYLTLAKRSLRDVMRVMAGGQSESDQSGDLEAAQAAVCALFRRENARPEKVSWIDLMTHTTNSWQGLFHPRGGFRSLAEKLVDSIHRSGGRVLTRARASSLIMENGRAAGVSVSKMVGGVGGSSNGVVGPTTGNPVEFRVSAGGAVVSAIGVLETFDKFVSLAEQSLSEVKASDKLRARSGTGQGQRPTVGAGEDGAGDSKNKAKNKEGGGEHKFEPEGFQTLRGARPRVHLCVGLRGNWLEDLDGTASYIHHVRDSTSIVVGGNPRHPVNGEGSGSWGGPGRERVWYRISFMEPKESGSVSKSTTCCVVTSEMSDDMAEAIGSTKAVAGPRRFVVLPGKSSRERMKERLLRVLHDEFPLTKDRDEFVLLAEEQQPGLSHGPERYMAQGLRAPTKIPGFFLAGEDLTIGSMEGALEGGWIAAHAVLGYTPTEMLLKSRSLASDLPNLDKIYG